MNPSKLEARGILTEQTPVVFLPMGKVETDGQIDESEIRSACEVWDGFTYFRKEDILVAKITPCFENGKGAFLGSLQTDVGFGSTEFHVLRADRSILPKFLYHLTTTHEFRAQGTDAMTGAAGQKRVPSLFVEHFPISIPPLDEQRAIAAFLDRETKRIDKLVAKKRLLIERLAEYRTALITRTVTQGLPPETARAAGFDPSPRLKPSGTGWLGDVPVHWDVLQLRHLGEGIIGLTYSPQDVVSEGRGILVLRASNVVDGHIDYRDNVYVDCAVPERLIVRQGDILVCSRSGSRALIGKNARIDAESAGATFGAFMTVFRSENSEYLHYVFNSKLFENQSGAYSTSTINQLTLGTLNNIKVPWPPFAEQRAIAAFLDRGTERIDSLSDRVETAIERLQEYRTSLITAAVTGKIDVREPVYEEAV